MFILHFLGGCLIIYLLTIVLKVFAYGWGFSLLFFDTKVGKVFKKFFEFSISIILFLLAYFFIISRF
jgi:hypothetical protein